VTLTVSCQVVAAEAGGDVIAANGMAIVAAVSTAEILALM
jgi:hypothetical protein